MNALASVSNNTRKGYPELYQFFAGYFYQGWSEDYRWDGDEPSFDAVIRHFRAINPPLLINSVRDQISQLLSSTRDRSHVAIALSELGNGFDPAFEGLSEFEWLEQILEVLSESASTAIVLRERG